MGSNQRTEKHPFINRWATFNLPYMDEANREAWVIDRQQDYFGFLPNKQIEHLIVGSFPTVNSVLFHEGFGDADFAFFNCNDFNIFYDILETITGYNFFPENFYDQHEYTTSITSFFLQKQIGVTDIVSKLVGVEFDPFNLTKGNYTVAYNNVCSLLMSYKSIKNIYFTCAEVKYSFGQLLEEHLAIPECKQSSIDAYFGRHIALHLLQSPISRVRHRRILDDDQKLYEDQSIGELTKLIPFIKEENRDYVRYKIAQWAATLCQIPGFIQPEILDSPEFQEILCRL